VVRGWRAEAPEGSDFALVADRRITHQPGPKGYKDGAASAPEDRASLGHFRDTEAVREAVSRLTTLTQGLEAGVVLFRTPPSFSPSAENRDALRRFFSEIAPAEAFAGAQRIWELGGLWELESAVAMADELGLVLALDPLAEDPLAGDRLRPVERLEMTACYLRVAGLGRARATLRDDELEDLADLAERFERCWVSLGSGEKYRDAQKLSALMR
jgi:uncharacterized protein YecE (DUF72 family)